MSCVELYHVPSGRLLNGGDLLADGVGEAFSSFLKQLSVRGGKINCLPEGQVLASTCLPREGQTDICVQADARVSP